MKIVESIKEFYASMSGKDKAEVKEMLNNLKNEDSAKYKATIEDLEKEAGAPAKEEFEKEDSPEVDKFADRMKKTLNDVQAKYMNQDYFRKIYDEVKGKARPLIERLMKQMREKITNKKFLAIAGAVILFGIALIIYFNMKRKEGEPTAEAIQEAVAGFEQSALTEAVAVKFSTIAGLFLILLGFKYIIQLPDDRDKMNDAEKKLFNSAIGHITVGMLLLFVI